MKTITSNRIIWQKFISFFSSGRFVSGFLLVVVVIASIVVRLLGIRYGLPYTLHTDEPTIVDRALMMLRTGDYNPHFFNYGSLTIYFQAIVYAIYFVLRIAPGTENIHRIEEMPNHFFYLPGRLAVLALGVATVILVYRLTTEAYRGYAIGLTAAAILALLPVHVEESRYITPNVFTGLLSTLSIIFAVRIVEPSDKGGSYTDYILSGFFAGLAGSAKYNAAVVVIGMVVAHFLSPRKDWKGLLFGLGAMVFGFLVATPYAIIDPASFLYGVRSEHIHYRVYGHGQDENFWWYTQYIFTTGEILGLLVIIGLLNGFSLHWRKHLVVNAFFVCYFVFISSYQVYFQRNLLPIASMLAINAAVGIQGVVDVISKMRSSLVTQKARSALLVLMLCLAVFKPAWLSIERGLVLSRPDTLIMAGQWVIEHVPSSSRVCLGYERFAPRYIPPVPRDRYIILPFPYEDVANVDTPFWSVCQYVILDETKLNPLSGWTMLARFDPAELSHPGRRFGIYEVPSSLDNEGIVIEEFNNTTLLNNLVWLNKANTSEVSIANSNLLISCQNTRNNRDLVDVAMPLNLDIRDIAAISLRVRIDKGSYFTMETVVDGRYYRVIHANYYEGSGDWETIWIPLPKGDILNSIIISLSEPDALPTSLRHSLSVDWIRVHPYFSGVGTRS